MVSHEWHTEYAGYTIKPPVGDDGQWFIIKNGANIMPGAARLETEADAFMAVDVLEAVDGDGRKFWHLWRAIRGREGRPSHGHPGPPVSPSTTQRPSVTLAYSLSNNLYRVTQIRGNRTTVLFDNTSTGTVHVGAWLSEDDAIALGAVADLIINRHIANDHHD